MTFKKEYAGRYTNEAGDALEKDYDRRYRYLFGGHAGSESWFFFAAGSTEPDDAYQTLAEARAAKNGETE